MEQVTVYRSDPRSACYDFETNTEITGTKEEPQTVPKSTFVRRKIHSGELIESKETKQPQDEDVVPLKNPEPITIDVFSSLGATDQKEHLQKLEITGDDSNEEKRVALYKAYLEAQAQ